MELYPAAQIILTTPFQTAAGWTNYNVIESTCNVIGETAKRLGTPCVNLFANSGIYGAFETVGQNGRYLSDGLHLNKNGGMCFDDSVVIKTGGIQKSNWMPPVLSNPAARQMP